VSPAKGTPEGERLKAQKKRAAAKRTSARSARALLKQQALEAAEARASNPFFRCPDPENLTPSPFPTEAMRLGFAVKVLGITGLKSNDSRRWQQKPHLKVSLGYLCEIFEYLRRHDIHMYRMSSDLAPYQTHPDMPQFHNMINESRDELAFVGRLARAQDLRLSFHPSQYIVLNSDNEQLTKKSIADLESQAEMLDLMECGPEAVLVIHVGGAYGDRPSGCDRWCATWNRLSERVKRRLVLENDDIRFSAADVLSIHERTGVRCVFDYQHHWCFNPEGLPLLPTLERFLRTWPDGVRPKIHFSCARTEMREIKRRDRKTGLMQTVLQPPVWTGHADYNNPFETIPFLRSIAHLNTDIMLESKSKDLALLRLRADIARFAPDLATRYAISAASASDDPKEIELEKDPDLAIADAE
jgi:UV DNA damage endonuclease